MTTVEIIHKLTEQEQSRYTTLKLTIKKGFAEAIAAIQEIRNSKLYRDEYRTFEEFCQSEYGHTRQHINRLIRAHEIESTLEQIGSNILHESWAKPLTVLTDPSEQSAAILLAYSAAANVTTNNKPTAALLEEAVATIQEMKVTNGRVSIDEKMPAATASVIAKHHARVQEHIQETNEKKGINQGTVVLILKYSKCKLVAAAPKRRRVTFEFETEQDYQKLLAMLKGKNGSGLEMKLTKHYPKTNTKP